MALVDEGHMTDKVVLYTNPMSRGRIVHLLLEELGAPYELKTLSFEKREHKAPQYLAVNPMGKVPAIVHRGAVVTETAAICVYLADEFPAAGLAPKIGDPERGPYLRWFFFGAACFDPAIVDKEKAAAAEGITGKPANIVEKIVAGKLEKFFQDVALVDQPFIKEEKKRIRDLIAEAGKSAKAELKIVKFARFKVGEA